jgi:streptogramin lyase
MRSSRLNRVALVGAAALLTACMSTSGSIGKGSPPRVTGALRPVLTATFRPAGGVYGVTTGNGSAWATSGGSLYRIDPATDRSESILSLATASLSTLAYGAGSLWVTDDSAILRVDPATGKVTGTIPIVTSTLSFGDGALWTLDREGMVRIDPRTLAVRTLPLPFEKRPGFAVGEGAAWMSVVNAQCLSGCLLRLSLSSGRVVARVRGAGLFGLVATGDGAVWVSDGSAVVRINPTPTGSSRRSNCFRSLVRVSCPSSTGRA